MARNRGGRDRQPGRRRGDEDDAPKPRRGRGALADRLKKRRQDDDAPDTPDAPDAEASAPAEEPDAAPTGRSALANRLKKRGRGETSDRDSLPAPADTDDDSRPASRRGRSRADRAARASTRDRSARTKDTPADAPPAKTRTPREARRADKAKAGGPGRPRKDGPGVLTALRIGLLAFGLLEAILWLLPKWGALLPLQGVALHGALLGAGEVLGLFFTFCPFLGKHLFTVPVAQAPERIFAPVWARLHWIATIPWTIGCRVWRFGWRVIDGLVARVRWSLRLSLLSIVIGVFTLYFSVFGEEVLFAVAEIHTERLDALAEAGLLASFRALTSLAWVFAWLQIGAGVLAVVRLRPVLFLLKAAAASFLVLWLYFLTFLLRAPGVMYRALDDTMFKPWRNSLWVEGIWAWLPFFLLGMLFLVSLIRRDVVLHYRGRPREEPLAGDRIVEDIRTHGHDPRFRTSVYWAGFAHVFLLFLLPLIMWYGCMEEPYGIPKGSGNPIVEMVQVKPPKKKKEKKLVLNMNSAFIFWRPEIEDSEVMEDVEQETRDTYQATKLTGKPGKGGGKEGGWPEGMEDARVRFIRLEYDGGDWNQDMGVGSDHNLLVQLHKRTGYRIAPNTESIPIRKLRRYPEDRAPPFVFITGGLSSGFRIQVSSSDLKTLRWYCMEEGGMIFADNGGGHFDHHFRQLMRRVFPDKNWVDIADDDVIFQQPFMFPNGAPPMWHHSGHRAEGIKHQGRWIVFYHQGDLNDAWKDGHSGVREGLADQAYKMGMNVMVYAFNQYHAIHFE